MIKRIIGWSMGTLPPHGLKSLVIFALVGWGLEWGFYALLYAQYGALPDEWRQMILPRSILLIWLASWAVWRAYYINPAYRARYLSWLRTTPWEPGTPLPLGRIELAPQDAVWLLAAAMAFWHWPTSILVPLAFLIPYVTLITLINFKAKEWLATGLAVGVIATLPLAVMMTLHPIAALCCVMISTAAAERGWRRTLRKYPWDADPSSTFQINSLQTQEAHGSCAWWPFVHPWRGTTIAPLLDWRQMILLAGFCAWLAATLTATIDWIEVLEASRENRLEVTIVRNALPMIAAGVGAAVGLMRLYRYVMWCAWPISLRARWRTGRMLIPGYDKVFVAPIAALIAGVVLPRLLLPLGAPTAATAFITMFVIVMLAAGMGPTLAAWSLTGEYRMIRHEPLDKHRSRGVAST